MKTDAERFGVQRNEVGTTYEADLVLSVVTTYARYACEAEDRLMSHDFMRLLRLLRANPLQLVDTYQEFQQLRPRGDNFSWSPDAQVGLRLTMSPRNPLIRMLRTHYPPTHAVWRYIIVKTNRYR